jgi:cyclopropane fatty-acyl-phospholipid synthase-like methyltransferase
MLLLWMACTPEPLPEAPAPQAVAHEAGHDAHGPAHSAEHHRFDDADKWAAIFDDPARDVWQQPDQVVAWLDLSAGHTVADLGAGTGYLNQRLSVAVGDQGRVLAMDIEPNLIAHMTQRAETEGTANVHPTLVEPGTPGLTADSVDRVLVLDTYHHIENRRAYFGAMRPAMRSGGRLVIVDFDARETEHGPPVDVRLPADTVISELSSAGWRLVDQHALPEQYVLVFE